MNPDSEVILEPSDREKCSGFQGEVLVKILDLLIYFKHLNFSLSSKQGEVNQFGETFSPKSPSKLSPACVTLV